MLPLTTMGAEKENRRKSFQDQPACACGDQLLLGQIQIVQGLDERKGRKGKVCPQPTGMYRSGKHLFVRTLGKLAFSCAVLCNVSSLGKSGFQVPSGRGQGSGHHVGEEGGGDLDQRALRPRALQAVQGGALPPLLSCSSLGLLPVWRLWGGVLLSKMFAGCRACS